METLMIDPQIAFNGIIGIAAFFGGFILRSISDSLKELKAADVIMSEKINRIDVLVAGEYVKRAEFEKLSSAMFAKLDRIEDRLTDRFESSVTKYPTL